MRLGNRLDRLEQRQPPEPIGKLLLWPQGQSLDEALDHAKMTLADGPFFVVRLVGLGAQGQGPAFDPIYERDRHRLGESQGVGG